jgi:hypothetical protein
MKMILLALVVLASLLIIASGIWVGVALIRALALPRRSESAAKAQRQDGRP